MVSIDEGIQIDFSDEERLNAALPRIEIRQPDSKATIAVAAMPLNVNLEMTSTEEGMNVQSASKKCMDISSKIQGPSPVLKTDNRTTEPSLQNQLLGNAFRVEPAFDAK
jgi:hypothetical protein